MSPSWPTRILDHLELVDAEEAPHGLYGIRRAYAPEGRLPTAAHVLGAPGKIDLIRKCGFTEPSTDQFRDLLSFTAEGQRVSLQVLDYATTKVRHYGSAFRLDRHHTKQSKEPRWDLETLVPKLSRQSHRYGTFGRSETHAILMIAHYVAAREMEDVLGKTTDPCFLDRYSLAHHTREWEDRYARGFRTALHLWNPRNSESTP